MEFVPEYEEGHLLVAAVRVLMHREGRSPTPDEAAALLGLSPEKVHILVHELRKRGVLKALEGPFDLRLDVGDVAPLEELPKGQTGPAIASELEQFHSEQAEKKKEMERMFRGGEADKRRQDRVAKLEAEFNKFKPKPGSLEGLFRKPAEGEEAGEE
jgi:DNA-binding Lrp family transcriptional regulator